MGISPAAQLFGEIVIEAFDFEQVLDRNERDFFDRREPFGDKQMRQNVIDLQRVHEGLRPGAEFFLPAFGLFLFRHDDDVPAGQLRRKTDILSAPADGEAELFVRHHDIDPVRFLVEHDLCDFRGRQRVYDEGRGIGRPLDNVDLLALQFADHRLDAGAAHADAGADRVDAGFIGNDGDLGAAAGVAGNRTDLDDAVIDFRNLLPEQAGHKLGMGARQKNLRPAQLLPNIVNIGPHAVAGPEHFPWNDLVAPQHGFGAAEVDRNIAELCAFDDAVDDFSDAVLVFIILASAFGFANLLDDYLFGGLRGDTAEIHRRQPFGQKIPNIGFGVQFTRFLERNLGRVVLDRVGHFQITGQMDFAGLAVDLRPDIVLKSVTRPGGLLNGLLHRIYDFFRVNRFVPRDCFGDLKEFAPVEPGALDDFCFDIHFHPVGPLF